MTHLDDNTRSDEVTVREICRRVTERAGDTSLLVAEEVRRLAPLHTDEQRRALVDAALASLRGLGELDVFVRDLDVDEVMVVAGSRIWIDRNGALSMVGQLDDGRVDQLIERALAPLGRRVDRASPIVDARLPDGSRMCAVLPPVSIDGTTLSIRRFARRARPLSCFTDEPGIALLREILEARCNVLVSGATSSGKTSLVGALIGEIDARERIVVVEDTTELPIDHDHVVRLESRPRTVDGPTPIEVVDLVRAALRLRPDRIVVGEVRGDEVLGLVQAMNTGHDGSLSTCHANGPLDALLRLESLVLQAAPTWPLAAVRHQLTRSIDVIVHLERSTTDNRRHVGSIAEVIEHRSSDDLPAPRILGLVRPDERFEQLGALERGRT